MNATFFLLPLAAVLMLMMPLVPIYHGYSFSVKSSRLQGYNGFEASQNNQRVWEWTVTE